MKVLKLLLSTLVLCAMVFAQAGTAKPKDKGAAQKAHILKGKVTELNAGAKTLTVDHQAVPGYMDAMTMPYKVDKPDVFKSVKVGDQIQATVYDADYTLYDIKVVPGK